MNIDVKQDLIGKILYVFAFIFLGYTFLVAIKYPFLTTDGWFTKGMVSLPVMQQIYITAVDVHPPLYYLLLKFIVKILTDLNLTFDLIFTIKLVSIIPSIIILAISVTKIRKNYGFFVGGLFAFSIITMSTFFTQYLTARMYSWGMLFIVLGFLCVKPILEKNHVKYWILLSIFAALGAYTHYFVAIAFVSLYIILLAFTFIKSVEFFKNWLISTLIGIILYLPWLLVLFNQLNTVQKSYWIPPITLETIINCFTCYSTYYYTPILYYGSLILLFIFVALIIKDFIKNREVTDEFLLIGILTYILTILIGITLSMTFKPILIIRYIIPVSSIIWILISIYLGKIDLKNLAIILAILILLLGVINISSQMDEIYKHHTETEMALDFFSSINNNDTIVIYDGMPKYVRFCGDLTNVEKTFVKYELNNMTREDEYIKILNLNDDEFKIPYDINSYQNKDVYLVRDFTTEIKPVEGYNFTDEFSFANIKVTKITK